MVMSKKTRSLSVFVFVMVFMLSAVSSIAFGAAAAPSRREGMPTSAAEATSGLMKYLEEISASLNDNLRPSSETIEGANEHLKGCRSFLAEFKNNKSQVADYYVLTAWVNYYSGDEKNALRAAQKAYMTDRENPDAKAAEAILALLTDEKPAEEPKTPAQMRANGLIDLDTESLKSDMLGDKIASFKGTCLNSTTFEYNSGNENLCVIFWQIKEASGTGASSADPNGFNSNDPNDGSSKPRVAGAGTHGRASFDSIEYETMGNDLFDMGEGMVARSGGAKFKPAKKTDFDEEMAAFGELCLKNFGNADIKFAGVNTNKTASSKDIMARLMDSNWAWAQVMANEGSNPISQFAEISAEKPFMAIVDKSGTVKYAGSAYGFLPKMMLAKVLGTPLEVQQKKTDAQEVVKPVITPAPTRPVTAPRAAPRELEEFEKFQAEKELAVAKDLFLAKESQRLITPKRGIDMCREIMRKYPDTQYAIDAQTLLRENVDPRYRQRYGLTDEELGL